MKVWATAILVLLTTTISYGAFAAEEAVEVDYLSEMDDETYRLNPRLYRAEGEHQCQSAQSIGHTCKTLGVNFTDCNNAFFKLKQDDCCSGSRYGGNSINFKVTKCTNFN
jgi:hypothetical protein